MPCKNSGGAPEWRRRQLWRKRGADPMANIPWYRSPWADEIRAVCQGLISGELGYVEGSRRMAELSEIVLDAAHGDKWLHEDWAGFFQVLGSGNDEPGIEELVRTAASKLLNQAGSDKAA